MVLKQTTAVTIIENVSRRTLLRGLVAGTGLVLAFRAGPRRCAGAAQAVPDRRR